jgi:ATP-binding cassette subfamily B protein RaxB
MNKKGKNKLIESYFFQQIGIADCGLACLKMIFMYYNLNLDYEKLYEKYNISINGISIFELIEIAKYHGFTCYCLKLNLGQIRKLKLYPAIIHTSNNHFSVITKIIKNDIYLNDPQKGMLKVSTKDFSEIVENIKEIRVLYIIPAKHEKE